jgi:hypothetical protein
METATSSPRQARISSVLRYSHEVLFSVNMGFCATTIAQTACQWFSDASTTLELNINRWLHIPQSDFIDGYFGFYVPAVVASFCIWISLRLTSHSRLTNGLLDTVAGPLNLLGMPAEWYYLAVTTNLWGWYGSYNWRYGASPFEPVAAIAITIAYICRKWPSHWWATVPLLALHFFFWGLPIHAIGFARSVLLGPLVGFCASVVWVLYVNQSRKVAGAGVAVPA